MPPSEAYITALETGPTLATLANVLRTIPYDDYVTLLTHLISMVVLIGAVFALVTCFDDRFLKPIGRSISDAAKIMSRAMRFGFLGTFLLFIGSLLPGGPLPWPVIGLPLSVAVAFIGGLCLTFGIAGSIQDIVTSNRRRLEQAQLRNTNLSAIDNCTLTSAERKLVLARGFGGGRCQFTPAVVANLLDIDSLTAPEHLFNGVKHNPIALIVPIALTAALSFLCNYRYHDIWHAVGSLVMLLSGLSVPLYDGYQITKARLAVEAERAPQAASQTASQT